MYTCLNIGSLGINASPEEWLATLPVARAAGFAGADLPVGPGMDAAPYFQALQENG